MKVYTTFLLLTVGELRNPNRRTPDDVCIAAKYGADVGPQCEISLKQLWSQRRN